MDSYCFHGVNAELKVTGQRHWMYTFSQSQGSPRLNHMEIMENHGTVLSNDDIGTKPSHSHVHFKIVIYLDGFLE